MSSGFGRGGMQGLIVALLFFGPLLAAMLLYGPGNYRPANSTAHGTLLNPTPQVPSVAGTDRGGQPLGEDWLQGRWSILYFETKDCDADCRSALDRVTNVWRLLAKERSRVRRILLSNGPGLDRPEYLVVPLATDDPLREFFVAHGGDQEPLFIIDPLGNVVMRYPADAEPKGILEDMKRLLKLSRIG